MKNFHERILDRIKEYIDKHTEPAYVCHPNGDILAANRKLKKEFEISEKQMGNINIFDLFGANNSGKVDKVISRMKEGKATKNILLEVKNSKREIGYYKLSSAPLKKEDKINTFFNVVLDVTKQKNIEERYRFIVENMGDLISVIDKDLNPIYINGAVKQVSGFSKEELMERSTLEFLHPDDIKKVAEASRKAFKEGSARAVYRMRNKKGHYNWVEGMTKLSVDKNGEKRLIVVSRDITPQKKAEQNLKRKVLTERALWKISNRFLGEVDIDRAINASLEEIGKLREADRVYLFLFSEDGKTMNNTHEWCAKGVTTQIENLQNLPTNDFPWWMSKLQSGEIIHIADVSKMPKKAKTEREILESQNIKSILVVPMKIAGKLSGYIGFDNVSETGLWS